MRMKWVTGAMSALVLVAAAAPAEAQWRRHHHHHGGGNGGALVGSLIAGALIGGAIASSQRGYYGPGYAPRYGYAPTYAGPPVDAIRYCMSRFRSYDPRSGTYLGYDGYRHACP